MTDNQTTELLPCPWCGVDMKLHAINYPWADGDPGWNIWHEDMGEAGRRKCPMEMGCYDTREDAIAAWNTRAELRSEREKALEELVRDMWFWGYEGHMDSNSQDWQMKHIDGVLDRMKQLGVEVIDE